MVNNKPIGVFDSGLGGLSVVKELKNILPQESIVYFGDTGRVPYGTKSKSTIIKYAIEDERFLISKDVKMVIAACGTVSSVAANTGKKLPVPFIDVVGPTAKAAVSATKNMKIGILGTSATINSNSFDKAIKKINKNISTVSVACPLFVQLVESGWFSKDDEIAISTAKRYLSPLVKEGVDTIILGCTHFPMLSGVIKDIVGDDVALINSGQCTAMAAAEFLKNNYMLSSNKKGKTVFYVSDKPESFTKTASYLLGDDIGKNVKFADVSDFGAK